MLANLVTFYVDAIRSGVVPCVEDASTALAKRENTKAIESAFQLYMEKMDKGLTLPTKDDDVLAKCHFRCRKEATEEFRRLFFLDADYHQFFEELTVSVRTHIQ